MKYRPTIGLEVHAELKTQTKMFCHSPNDPDAPEPNTNVCPVCMGHPGTLPVINKAAVKHVCKIGRALGGTLADFTEFDRKNYFYPDIPKGYQISQYQYPLVAGGELAGVTLTRIHLEEDTARSTHDTSETHSVLDFNRAGVPLMELVTEPVVASGEQAGAFARELQLLLRYLGASDANLEKGEMRIEANVSISDTETFGTKVEVKNLNSFRSVERAIAHEIERQQALLERGEAVQQETRGWDEEKQRTYAQRVKEGSADYRYFPDPDLPKLKLSELPEFSDAALREELPEMPWERRERYAAAIGKTEPASVIANEPALADFFDAVAEKLAHETAHVALAANYLTSDVLGYIAPSDIADAAFSADAFATLIQMTQDKEISSRGAKEILRILVERGGDPREIAEAEGLVQQSDAASLEPVIDAVISENPSVAEDYRGGKEAALQFLVGQGMKATKGAADPNALKELFQKKLSS